MGDIKHTTTGTGTKVTNTVWSEAHTYDASSGTNALKFVWKTTSIDVWYEQNRTANLAWTDVDITSKTSVNAKLAYLQMRIGIDTATKNYQLGIRKNGETPSYYPTLRINSNLAFATEIHRTQVWVGLDTDQIFEVEIEMPGGGQADYYLYILGYME